MSLSTSGVICTWYPDFPSLTRARNITCLTGCCSNNSNANICCSSTTTPGTARDIASFFTSQGGIFIWVGILLFSISMGIAYRVYIVKWRAASRIRANNLAMTGGGYTGRTAIPLSPYPTTYPTSAPPNPTAAPRPYPTMYPNISYLDVPPSYNSYVNQTQTLAAAYPTAPAKDNNHL